MAGEMLPPVVITVLVNSTAAEASMAGLKGSVAATAASIDASTSGVGRSMEGMGASAAAGGAGMSAAEKDIESNAKGFSGRTAMMFESLGNSMSSFGIPFGNSVKKMGYSMKEGESATKGFGSSLMGLSKIAAVAGLGLAVGIGVASLKAADQFDVAQTRLKQAVADTGKSFKALEPLIVKTEKAGTNFGFTMTETASSLAKLTVATKDPTKATGEMGLAMDLARMKGVSLETATQGLVKLYGGSTRALMSMGIQLNIGSTKLAAYTKATEAVTKAKATLKAAEENMVVAQKKGEEEHAKAIEKVTTAEETLKHAQETLSSDSGSLTAAQEALKTAQNNVTEAAQKQKTAVKEASAALKAAEESAREAAETGAKSVEAAKKNLGNLETERAKEGNEAGIKTIEGEEKVLEAVKTTASEAALAQLKAKKAALEATDKGIEATKKEEAVQTAHKGIIEAEATAHKNNTKAISAVAKAHDTLVQKQRLEEASSKENVAAHHAVTAAARTLSNTEVKLSRDQEAVAKAQRGLSTAQREAAAPPKAVQVAQEKLTKAHEALSKAQNTVKKDSGALGEVLSYLAKISAGQAAAATHTAAGEWSVFKAKLNEAEIELGTKMMPTLVKMIPILKSMVPAIGWVGNALANAVSWWGGLWETIGFFFYSHVEKIKAILGVLAWFTPLAFIKMAKAVWPFVQAIVKVAVAVGKAIGEVVGFFFGMGVKIVSAVAGIIGDMVNFGKNLVKAIINGITSAPGAIVNAIKGLIPGGSIIGEAASAIGLATGGIVTKPTLAVVGEAGPEAVIPLKGGIATAPHGIQPLPTPGPQQSAPSLSSGGSGGLTVQNLTVNGMATPNAQVVQELYRALRPMLQSA